MNLKDRWIKFIYNFAWFSKFYFSLTMKISKNLPQCIIPVFSNPKQITEILNYGNLYKHDNLAEVIKDYLIHPRTIQCRLLSKKPFGDCDDHAIYWCTVLKKSNLAKKVWFSIYSMKGRWPDDTYSAHAVCVFQDHDEKLYWCDYKNPNLIEKIEDFQVQSAKLYGCDAICGSIWEVVEVKNDDTPVFGRTTRVLPPKK